MKYPPVPPNSKDDTEFRKGVLAIHQDYLRRVLELERTVMQMSAECDRAYIQALDDYVESFNVAEDQVAADANS